MYKIYVIGPLPISTDVIGGTKVAFSNLVDSLTQDDQFELGTLNTSRGLKGKSAFVRQLLNIVALLKFLFFSLIAAFRYDVLIWNVSPTALPLGSVLFRIVTHFGRAKTIVRIFGGNFDILVDRQMRLTRTLMLSSLFSQSAVLFETRHLVDRFAGTRRNIHWFPNTRDYITSGTDNIRTECRRFLYLGQLRKEKGIPEIISAAQQFHGDVTVTACGPLMDGYSPLHDFQRAGITYLPPVTPSEVRPLLARFDALLFPSYYPGEGYPGVIIEALQSGMPVVTTYWRSLPELIVQDANGILVEPRDPDGLFRAMSRLCSDSEYYSRLCNGAIRTGKRFTSASAVSRLKSIIEQLMRTPTK